MPVKVRCGECEQVLNVPDKARGKTIACPKCSGKIKVPAGEADAPPAKAPSKPKGKSQDDGSFLGGIDDHRMEDQDEGVCPFCAEPVDFEEDEICPSCGRDLETGLMSAKEKKKRSKEGKSSAHFYKNFLGECWEFTKEFKSLAIRTGMYNTMFSLMYFACLFMVGYCENIPPMIFWFVMTVLTGVATPGWFWFLTKKIVHAHLYNEKIETDRIFYDFFTVVSLGLGMCIWPFLLGLPFLHALLMVAGGEYFELVPPEVLFYAAVGIGGVCSLLASFAFPVATIHLCARYKHKAWIMADMLRIAFHNIGPIMVYHLTAICLGLVVVAIPTLVAFFGGGVLLFTNPHLLGWADQVVVWFLKLTGDANPAADGFVYNLIKIGMMFTFAGLAMAPIQILAGFPAIFMMKLNGLIARHFQHTLDLDQMIRPGVQAGFWVRYLAGATDFVCVPLASFLVSADPKQKMIAWAINGVLTVVWIGVFMEWYSEDVAYKAAYLWVLYNNWLYYAVPMASTNRATLGMEAFGLIVMRDNPELKQKDQDKPLTLKESSFRWFLHLVFVQGLFGFISLSGLFNNGKPLHDVWSKTKIVFKGDK